MALVGDAERALKRWREIKNIKTDKNQQTAIRILPSVEPNTICTGLL